MKGFLLALQFLTIIPVKVAIDKNKLSQALAHFPLIGLFLGLILTGINNILSYLVLEKFVINVILVILLIILTGGLHLDGLADTVDAILSRKDKSQMLEIMRDSHIGTMGVLGLISIILIKISLLCSLSSDVMNISLILMCLLSRYSLVFAMFLFPYAREQGKAKLFIENMNIKIFSLTTIISLLFTVILLRLKGFGVFIAVVSFVILIGKFIANKIGGMSGDSLGAINELVEVFVLLNILILNRVWI